MKLSRFFVSSMKFTSVHGTFLTWYRTTKGGPRVLLHSVPLCCISTGKTITYVRWSACNFVYKQLAETCVA